MPHRIHGKRASWRCVRRDHEHDMPPCAHSLLSVDAFTALVEHLPSAKEQWFPYRYWWGVCPRLTRASLGAAVQAIYFGDPTDPNIGRGHTKTMLEARRAAEAWIAAR